MSDTEQLDARFNSRNGEVRVKIEGRWVVFQSEQLITEHLSILAKLNPTIRKKVSRQVYGE